MLPALLVASASTASGQQQHGSERQARLGSLFEGPNAAKAREPSAAEKIAADLNALSERAEGRPLRNLVTRGQKALSVMRQARRRGDSAGAQRQLAIAAAALSLAQRRLFRIEAEHALRAAQLRAQQRTREAQQEAAALAQAQAQLERERSEAR